MHNIACDCTIRHVNARLCMGLRAPRQVLREQLQCELPVEVIYNGPMEMTPEILARFEARRATSPASRSTRQRHA